MNEPFRFKLMMRLPPGIVDAVHTELAALEGWRVHQASTLGTSHRKSVSLRGHPGYPVSGIAPLGMVGTCQDARVFSACPATRELLRHLMHEYSWAELGLVTVSRMTPGGVIAPHIDGGAYFNHYHRIQIPLQACEGIEFTCEDETVQMKAGEVWCFDNKRVHSVRNHGLADRTNLYFDAR